MLEIVDQANRHHFEDALHDMHRMRYRAAVQEMGWHIDVPEEGYDKDAFDYPDTVYILYFNPDGSVGACGRLNRTTRPHLLSEVFPHHCVDGVPRGDDIIHFSRYLIERRGKTQQEFMRAWMLVTQAVNEWGIEHGIRQTTWLARKRLYGMSLSLWNTRPLGPARFYKDDGKEYIAAISEMNADGLAKVARWSKRASPVARYTSSIPGRCRTTREFA
ncbi:MAG: acyl-homoserine-lactone synthase [Litorimonas sp.]